MEELGLLAEDDVEDVMDITPATSAESTDLQLIGRDFSHLPWFENMTRGSRLGSARTSRGIRESRDGTTRIEWEITEWTGDDDDDDDDTTQSAATGKRKRGNTDQDEAADASAAQVNVH